MRMDYHLILQMNQDEIMLGEGETYDEWIDKNIFPVIVDQLKKLGLTNAGVGFMHYAHVYPSHTSNNEDTETKVVRKF